jgi:ABC-type transport system involved in cytochrome c biogenesis permease component
VGRLIPQIRLGSPAQTRDNARRMTFLPVVERELRVAARRRETYRARFVAAILASAFTAFVLRIASGSNAEKGATLFQCLAALVFLFATLVGTVVTGDCISEEKREGTLGLLFLTDLKGYDVVLGKLVARSVNSFYGMAAVVPVLAIAFLMGGVTRGELLRVALVSMNLLFFCLSAGMVASALCRRDRSALGLSAALVILLAVAGPLATQLHPHPNAYPHAALISSPVYGCFLVFDDAYKGTGRIDFVLNAVTTQLYAWTFLGLACWITPRSWQDKGTNDRWRQPQDQGASSRRASLRATLLEVNPFLWRASRGRWKRTAVWLALVIQALVWLWYGHTHYIDLFDPATDVMVLLCAGLCLKMFVAGDAGRTLAEDRRSGALELILVTPLPVEQIVRGQLLALRRRFLAPVAAVLLANAWFLVMELRHGPNLSLDTDDRNGLIWLHLVIAAFLVMDLLAISWVAIWRGLLARKPNWAGLPALLLIVLLSCTIFVLAMSLVEIVNPSWPGLLVFWCLLGLTAIGFFAPMARLKLLNHFRAAVSGDYRKRWPRAVVPEVR